MLAKLRITGEIEVVTGLHIGGSNEFSAIGAVDSPVIRDTKTRLPIIPGSSVKGKMRTLLARARSEELKLMKCSDEPDELLRLFGSSDPKKMTQSRLKFSDCFMTNADTLNRENVSVTEVKFENTINRLTSVANPRQIERVVRGSLFGLEIIYDVQNESEAASDFAVLKEGLTLIEYDYLGGHGSRGSGRVRFSGLSAELVYGKIDENILSECVKILGN